MFTEVGQHHVVPTAYEALILYAAQTCPGVTAPLLATQLDAESGWNLNAVSPVGAQGLAQFMPGTWVREGVDGDADRICDLFNPADVIASQASLMCKLLAAVWAGHNVAGDQIDLALAAYNAGHGAVQKYAGVPPYAETQNYVLRIRSLMASYLIPIIWRAGPALGVPGCRPCVGPREAPGALCRQIKAPQMAIDER